MSDTPEYILRKPLKAFVENDQYDEACYAVVADDGLAWQFMDKESFDELFKPLDIPAIEKQLEQILRKLTSDSYIIGWANGKNEPGGQNLDECRERTTTEVLALLGLENKETE